MKRVALLLFAVLLGLPSLGWAKTFAFLHAFEVASLGASNEGTPRGLAFASVGLDGLLVSDALDDQIFVVDDFGNPTGTWETDPFDCAVTAVPLDCTPTQDWARVIWDVAWDGSSAWAVDKDSAGGSTTWLIQLNPNGQFARRIDADGSGANPGGLTFDPRGAGGLLLTDRGSDWVTHFDLDGVAQGISSLAAFSQAATGIAHFGGDLFFVTDSADDAVYEVTLSAAGGDATLVGQTIFQGFDVSTLIELESVDYDPQTGTLYLLDAGTDSVYLFSLIPEPGTGLLLAAGLCGLAARRRRA